MKEHKHIHKNGAQDFNDGDNSEVEYEYDCNGALKRDSNRGIDIISYDYGHHPNNVSMGMRHIRYDYTPDGRKLSTSHATTISKRVTNVTTDTYIDGLILRNGKPQMWQFSEGYVELDDNGTPTSWNYYITDHLGSTRMVVDSNNNIKETINYYPFGSEMRMENPALMVRNNKKISMETAGFTMPSDSAVNIKEPGILMPIDSVAKGNEPALASADFWQRYRFSGKELDKQNGLNMYDFGARLFDVAGVPMWTSVDPLAEKYYHITPYSYCAGNPVSYIDEHGDSCIVLLAPYGAKGYGHMAIGIQNKKGEWCLYSKNGTYENGGFSGKEGAKGSEKHNDRGEKKANNINDFFRDPSINPPAQDGNPTAPDNAPEYTQGYIIPTTPEQDKKLQTGALSEINKDYNLLFSNCAQTVQNALSSAGLSSGNGIIPKYQVFPSIVVTNKGQIYNYYDTRSKKYIK